MYVTTECGIMSNELAVERQELIDYSPHSDEELANWWERLGNWWHKYHTQGFGDGSGMASHCFHMASKYRGQEQ